MTTPLLNMQRAWVGSPDVQRVPHDDDALAPRARLRPTTTLTKAVADVLQGSGFLIPVGDGTYMVEWLEGV